MKAISYQRYRFRPDTIRLAVRLYFRFTASLRDVEEMLAQRGIDVTYETVGCWANKFRPAIAANIRIRRGRADTVWQLDEMVVRINCALDGTIYAAEADAQCLRNTLQKQSEIFQVKLKVFNWLA